MLFDFSRGVPALVDFAAMRDTVKRLGGDPARINPVSPADLVIDHSVQVDVFRRCGRERSIELMFLSSWYNHTVLLWHFYKCIFHCIAMYVANIELWQHMYQTTFGYD